MEVEVDAVDAVGGWGGGMSGWMNGWKDGVNG